MGWRRCGAKLVFPFHFLIERRCWEGAGGGGVSHQAAVPGWGGEGAGQSLCSLAEFWQRDKWQKVLSGVCVSQQFFDLG